MSAYPGRLSAHPQRVRTLPAAARLVAWGNAALAGSVSLDEATERITGGDPGHRVVGLPGEPGPVGFSLALGRLQALGVPELRLVLPVPGDPTGLPGPPAFNEVAIEIGHAVLAPIPAAGIAPAATPPAAMPPSAEGGRSLGLLERARGAWVVSEVEASRVTPMSVPDAHRLLRAELLEVTEELVRLDVARWSPEVAAALRELRSRTEDPVLPPSCSLQAHQMLALAGRLGAVVALGSATDGAAITATEMVARAQVLRRLGIAVRRAVEAACTDAN